MSDNKIDNKQKTVVMSATEEAKEKTPGILGAILKSLQSQEEHQAARLAFEVDPTLGNSNTSFGGLYRLKTNLTPDDIIKRIVGPQGDDLVSQIVQARANMISSFGRPRSSRFSIGYEFQPVDKSKIPDRGEEYEKLQNKLEKVKKFIWQCGDQPVDDEYFTPSFSQFLKMATRDAVAFGRFACERLYTVKDGEEVFCGFRAIDSSTIHRVVRAREKDQSARNEALRLLSELKNEKFDKTRYTKDEYSYVQVINNRPVQAFTDAECAVYNFYPSTNVEYNGYPLTPIDQALNAITTHISITLHNRLYFQNGRAAKGFLVFQSDDIDDTTVNKIKAQFNHQINNVSNSWRMPVFGVGKEDQVSFQNIDTQGRDAEFQYLSDNNARVILSAFQMSPEELPGYAHLARGTNTQALSESDNEWKLQAARDVGLRPLLFDFQDFLNKEILPLIDDEVAELYQLVLSGLDKDSPEKEATRIQQDMAIHLTYNDIMESVEKNKLPTELGGDIPLNQTFHQLVIGPYLTVGQILESFFGVKGASQDPRLQYRRDPFYFQQQQILMQKAQIAMQTQMQQQQAMAQQQQAAQGEDPNAQGQSDDEQEGGDEETQKMEAFQAVNYDMLAKATEHNSRRITKQLLKRHKELTDHHLDRWLSESKKALETIVSEVEKGKK